MEEVIIRVRKLGREGIVVCRDGPDDTEYVDALSMAMTTPSSEFQVSAKLHLAEIVFSSYLLCKLNIMDVSLLSLVPVFILNKLLMFALKLIALSEEPPRKIL